MITQRLKEMNKTEQGSKRSYLYLTTSMNLSAQEAEILSNDQTNLLMQDNSSVQCF